MDTEKMRNLHLTPIEDFIEEDFGKEGTAKRTEFELNADAFIIGLSKKQEKNTF